MPRCIAYVADGAGGLKVVQLFSPETQPKFYGFSPDVKPKLIASYATGKPALSVSRGLERDRAVDETGGQIAVLGRVGSRPFTQDEMKKLYLDANGNRGSSTIRSRVRKASPPNRNPGNRIRRGSDNPRRMRATRPHRTDANEAGISRPRCFPARRSSRA
jgi:hypothetical protein